MKKILIILVIILLTGCNKENTTKIENNSNNTEEPIIENQEIETDKNKTYIDNNPIKPGIYMYYGSNTDRVLLKEYTTNWSLNIDLCSLEIYYTTDESIPGTNQKKLWNTYKNNYENIDNYRIGYKISFETQNNEKIEKYLLSPKDTNDIYDYMQIYLYDDINQQDGSWYSHITEEEYTNNSILTSIKLTGSTKTNEITSDITLMVFTYDEDDFDENNEYRGISKSIITIKRS